jgi:hypothetical protein
VDGPAKPMSPSHWPVGPNIYMKRAHPTVPPSVRPAKPKPSQNHRRRRFGFAFLPFLVIPPPAGRPSVRPCPPALGQVRGGDPRPHRPGKTHLARHLRHRRGGRRRLRRRRGPPPPPPRSVRPCSGLSALRRRSSAWHTDFSSSRDIQGRCTAVLVAPTCQPPQ